MTKAKKPGSQAPSADKGESQEQSREEFLAALAHELRDPLAPICAGIELLKLARDKLTPYDEIISMMERQTRQLVTLVDHLMEMSRIERGALLLKKRKVRLGDIIQSATTDAASIITEAGLTLSVSQPRKSIYLEADPQRLSQAIGHLLSSAAKFARSGGGIQLTIKREGSNALIAVSYEGKSLAENKSRAESTECADRRDPAPAAIGLSLVYSLAELHQGKLEVSRQECGCVYSLRLPILEIMSTDLPPPSTSDGLRVLIVDDNRDAARMLGKVIEIMGNESRVATDGRMAVEVAAFFRPQVILMDLDMPEMDGYQAARLILGKPWSKGVTLVALTGWGQEKDRQRSLEAGFDHHLLKPVEPYQLHKLLADVAKNSRKTVQ